MSNILTKAELADILKDFENVTPDTDSVGNAVKVGRFTVRHNTSGFSVYISPEFGSVAYNAEQAFREQRAGYPVDTVEPNKVHKYNKKGIQKLMEFEEAKEMYRLIWYAERQEEYQSKLDELQRLCAVAKVEHHHNLIDLDTSGVFYIETAIGTLEVLFERDRYKTRLRYNVELKSTPTVDQMVNAALPQVLTSEQKVYRASGAGLVSLQRTFDQYTDAARAFFQQPLTVTFPDGRSYQIPGTRYGVSHEDGVSDSQARISAFNHISNLI